MPKTANNKARSFVQDRLEFEGSNLKGEWRNNKYVVTSYRWYAIFIYKDGHWYENANRYSMSTAKQMTQCRPHGVPITVLSEKDMQSMWH